MTNNVHDIQRETADAVAQNWSKVGKMLDDKSPPQCKHGVYLNIPCTLCRFDIIERKMESIMSMVYAYKQPWYKRIWWDFCMWRDEKLGW